MFGGAFEHNNDLTSVRLNERPNGLCCNHCQSTFVGGSYNIRKIKWHLLLAAKDDFCDDPIEQRLADCLTLICADCFFLMDRGDILGALPDEHEGYYMDNIYDDFQYNYKDLKELHEWFNEPDVGVESKWSQEAPGAWKSSKILVHENNMVIEAKNLYSQTTFGRISNEVVFKIVATGMEWNPIKITLRDIRALRAFLKERDYQKWACRQKSARK